MMIMKFLLASMLLVASQAQDEVLEYEITAHVNAGGNFEIGQPARLKDPFDLLARIDLDVESYEGVFDVLNIGSSGSWVTIDLGNCEKFKNTKDLIALRNDDTCLFRGKRKYKLQEEIRDPGRPEYLKKVFKSDRGDTIVIDKSKSTYEFQCKAGAKWEFDPSKPYAPMRLITSWNGSRAIYAGAYVEILGDKDGMVTFKVKDGEVKERPKRDLTCVSELRIMPTNEDAIQRFQKAGRARLKAERRRKRRAKKAAKQWDDQMRTRRHTYTAPKKPKKSFSEKHKIPQGKNFARNIGKFFSGLVMRPQRAPRR